MGHTKSFWSCSPLLLFISYSDVRSKDGLILKGEGGDVLMRGSPFATGFRASQEKG